MKRIAVLIVLLAAMSSAAGCDDDTGDERVLGSGTIIAESRPVDGFEEIVVNGRGRISIGVGEAWSLTVETDDNLLPLVETTVRGSRLDLDTPPEVDPTDEIIFTITMPDLRLVTINGSGDLTAAPVGADSFDVIINGSGSVDLSGTAETLNVQINGSGSFDGGSLVAGTGSVEVGGSGDVLVNVTETLDASVSGSGSIRYLGNPTLSETISGSGSISPG